MLPKKIIKVLKITYLIFVVLIAIAMLFSKLSFPTSSKDILIERLSNFSFYAIIFILPSVFILSQSIRKKIPLFKKEKLVSTILGWALLFVIGMIVYSGINSFHSVEYNVAKSKYDAEIEAKKIEANKIKEEAKIQAKRKKEAEDKAKEDAKAKEIADAKKLAEDKAKADADAKAKADGELQAKAIADAKAKADADAKAVADAKIKSEADAKAKAEKDFDDWVNSQFSPWDGSNYNLVELIKNNMNDPHSFEHIETRQSIEKGKGITLYMKYRGKNAFGGLIINTVEAYANYNTQVLHVTKVNGVANK